MAALKPQARYIVFHCLDEMVRTADRSGFYYESIDLFDAFHPQTILYEMNGKALPVRHGAPLRLLVERHVGYKHVAVWKECAHIKAADQRVRDWSGQGNYAPSHRKQTRSSLQTSWERTCKNLLVL